MTSAKIITAADVFEVDEWVIGQLPGLTSRHEGGLRLPRHAILSLWTKSGESRSTW